MDSRKIILGVAGGIAAYKTPELVRRLRDRGAEVQVVMTRSAAEFVTETTLQAVSGFPVRSNLWDKDAEAAMGHIELARWADLVLIAPATAEIMARLASGAAPDLLTTLCLATQAPLVIAPAMNHVMWSNPAVQANRQLLEERGIRIIGPDSGDQACGETGVGRMTEPDVIAAAVTGPTIVTDGQRLPLFGRKIMITAGPTREAIDPVRYISNRSSGKMGFAMARAAVAAGADVVLVSGPVDLATPDKVQRIDVVSAQEMFAVTHQHVDGIDIFIAAAAVADYSAAHVRDNKIKKAGSKMSIELVRTPDTLASVARLEHGPFTVGFAAETEKLREYATSKLEKKNLDMIIANQVDENRGIDSDDNTVDVFWATGEQSFPMMAKKGLAVALMQLIARRYGETIGTATQAEFPAIAVRD
ncbi:fused 4'-phosphopantothenoylcysteine decarboxylase; phosphopantothenoylcysteine synthetase, FMN-binding [uncultured Woeseiaceae bacterium]|uniref:Coenzyme A biosynthesis bifunctional protein CoaBC n=1 Tax=uncultured Woeseiaceae bacterium TaxID=1983305 RepID=A0A7D9H5E2_9GAMM|nr:fused 4'-phosphopantothenoylcysteine decarboxylase; phosphopantothenoylcysteine synthetase, FMN-binding [uncultured Woeseiaceae bacterium]